jgi:hypothetical protein
VRNQSKTMATPDESSTAPATESQRSMLCVDSSGLCLAATGDFKEEDAGIYHNLVHLASQLSAATKQNPRSNNNGDITPVIRIETDDGCTLVKTYEAHTVAVRIPARGGPPLSDGGDEADTPNPGNDDNDDDIIIVTGPDASSDQ